MIIWPNSTSVTQVDGARSSHPQNIDTTQKVATINDSKSDSTHQMSNPQSDDTTQQVATTVDSISDSNYQMSTNGGSSMTQETSVTAIVLSIYNFYFSLGFDYSSSGNYRETVKKNQLQTQIRV